MAQSPNEISETRLLLVFLLMGAIMFLTPYFFKSAPPPQKKGAATSQTAPPPAAATQPAAASTQAEPEAAPVAAPTSPATDQKAAPPMVIDTEVFRITFSNQGATVRSWVLKKYKGNDGKPLDLVNTSAAIEEPYPFSLYIPERPPTLAKKLNWSFYRQAADEDGLGVSYEFSDGHAAVHKTFRFQKNSYLAHVTSELAMDGNPAQHLLEWRGGFGDLTVANPAATEQTLYYDLNSNKLVKQNARGAKNGPVTAGGNFSFAGLEDSYFGAVFLPQGNTELHAITFADSTRTPLIETAQISTGVAIGDGQVNDFDVFVGPKDVNLLKSVNPRLEQVVDFGWLSFLAKPLFLIVNWFNANAVHNFGWAIVLVTVVINFILFPLKLSNMKSMRKMQALKPQIDGINAKYKNVGIRDPRKADQNQEVMDLYKKHGVNPMGGCFPMLLQIPFFIAFYKVFTVSSEMRGATWLWVTDLSQPEHLPIKILPVVMIASQFIMQKMTPQATGGDPSQQKMMMFMPLIFGFMFYNFPSGLVLYYLTSNLVSMGQQWFFNHTDAAQVAAQSVEPPKKKNGRK
jgi:YidC/Oxa1 family membrane protein insertase